MTENQEVEITGTVEDVSVHIDETGFTVLELCSEDEFVTVVGILPEIAVGEKLTVRGNYDTHPLYGRQLRASSCVRSMPSSSEDLYKYLSAGTVKGIGPATAQKIIQEFGEDAFDVLENHPEKLCKIKGISREKANTICTEFTRQFAVRQTLIVLEKYGMTSRESLNTYKIFGFNAVEIVRNNPYLLCAEGIGINFERADAIAASLPDSPPEEYRIRAGVLHILRHNLGNGHTCCPREKMLEPATQLLQTDEQTVEKAIDSLLTDRQLESAMLGDKEFLFIPNVYRAEKNAAKRIKVLCAFPPAGRPTLLQDIENIEYSLGIKYEQKQKLAIITAVEKGVLILTGGPGTGKTTTINGMIELFKQDKLRISLAAPTGRAAKRMSEITGMPAKTIHRLLEVEWDDSENQHFARNERNPIDADVLIVDELSMIDIQLFSSLLDALPLGCRLIMVGDSDQLPPVGAGNVLHDMIESGMLPVVELKEIFRQAQRSLIVTNAHKIVSGELPDLSRTDSDFFFLNRQNSTRAAETVAELCAVRLPKAFKLSPVNDIQVLCPSRKGEMGTYNLNRRLQEVINPASKDKREQTVGMFRFREGDKVMHIKNNYDIMWKKPDGEEGSGVFNGDIGTILSIRPDGTTKIRFDDGRESTYFPDNMRELELAYAVTVHKSQGNEFEAVVLPLLFTPDRLAYRNLLYTAVTRAKKLIIIVGSENQVYRMARNDKKARRYSALKHFLLEDNENGQLHL
ncbi:MAG: ATP-dependent RecD-like DNA helicase [Clostridia bacterium]|nr:ATP-dependent RecD-like DNA helicase [Clostridia bacterium]